MIKWGHAVECGHAVEFMVGREHAVVIAYDNGGQSTQQTVLWKEQTQAQRAQGTVEVSRTSQGAK